MEGKSMSNGSKVKILYLPLIKIWALKISFGPSDQAMCKIIYYFLSYFKLIFIKISAIPESRSFIYNRLMHDFILSKVFYL